MQVKDCSRKTEQAVVNSLLCQIRCKGYIPMKESTDRLNHLYGSPASAEQIKIYFNTLSRTYIELSEKCGNKGVSPGK